MIIWDLPKTEEEAVKFFQEKGVSVEIPTCDKIYDIKFYIGDEI